MQKFSVYLLQDTKENNRALEDIFISDERFTVVGSSVSGTEGAKEIENLKPDFVIAEIVIKDLDGIGVIQRIRPIKETDVIVLSVFSREEIIGKAMQEGAKYFMVKPFSAPILKERMIEIKEERFSGKREEKRGSLDEKISNIFINVGIPPHIKGYSFLREGVKIAVKDPSVINNITKKLYPMIGEKYNTTPSKVERAIRHAIEVAWNRGRIENINGILGVRAYVGQEKPTNGEFIALVADKMLLEQA